MSIRNGLLALGALTLGFSACSGGGGGGAASSGLLQEQPPLSSGATSQTATRTYQIGSGAGSYDLPPLGGFGGSLELPATSVPANTRLELTSSLQAPAGAPMLQNAERRPQDTGTLDVYFYTTIRLTSTVEFPTLPGFSVTLPATVKPAGLQFFYAISSPKPTNGAQAQFRTEGPASVADQTITFVPSTTPLTLQAGQPYVVALYAISAIAATPAPTFTGKIYVVNRGDATLTTYTANGAPTSPTITGLSRAADMTVDAAGKVYIANPNCCGGPSDNTVTTYTASGTQTTPTIHFGPDTSPGALAVDTSGKIYVVDDLNWTLKTYTANGTPTTPTIVLPPPSSASRTIVGVAVDAAGKIYVASDVYEYERFNLIDFYSIVTTYTSTGAPTTPTFGGKGTAVVICGVAVDATGKVYVVSDDFGCSDNVSGNKSLMTYTTAGVRTTPTIEGLSDPEGVAVDAFGKIYVANAAPPGLPLTPSSNTITTYTANGTRTTPTIAGLSDPVHIMVH
jgi:hypothetical protein